MRVSASRQPISAYMRQSLTIQQLPPLSPLCKPDSSPRTRPERLSGDPHIDQRIAIQLIQHTGNDGEHRRETRQEGQRCREDLRARRGDALGFCGSTTDDMDRGNNPSSETHTAQRGARGAVNGGRGDFESRRVGRLVTKANQPELNILNSPMKVPFSHDAGYSDAPDSSYHTPCPDPDDGDEEDEPSRIRANMEDPGVLPGMPPVADGAESDKEGKEWDRGDCEDAE